MDAAVAPRNARNDLVARALLVACALLPALFAAAHASGVADAAHDEGVVRVVGLGFTGALRALDAVVAAPMMLVPVGTRALRAAFASSLLAGVAGALAFRMARALLATCAPETRLGLMLAAVASTAATLSVAFQIEAVSVGGAMLGVVLALAPLDTALADGRVDPARFPRLALFVALALSYEPLVGFGAVGSLVAYSILTRRPHIVELRAVALPSIAGLALGLAPFALALARRALVGGEILAVGPFAAWSGERGASPLAATKGAVLGLLLGELGVVVLALALLSGVVAALVPRARAGVLAVATLVFTAFAASAFGAPLGPSRFGAPVLAGLTAVAVLAAVGMQSLVRAIATTRVPFAQASATMVVLLLVAIPLRAADDSALRLAQRPTDAAALWDEVAYGAIPTRAVVFVHSPLVMTRLQASRASGAFRDDLEALPTFDLGGPGALRELAHEPLLTSFLRDMALTSVPEEFSLATVAATRPLAMTYDPKWDRALARHLVPAGLFANYETEPRASSDRRIALDAFAASHERLAAVIAKAATPAKPFASDQELERVTAHLLRARLVGLAASHDRELLPRAAEDIRPFAADDPIATEVLRRAAVSKGAVDVKDLIP